MTKLSKMKWILLTLIVVTFWSCQTKEEKRREEFVERIKSNAKKYKESQRLYEQEKLEELQNEKAVNKARGIIRVEDIYAEFKANEIRCKEKYHLKRLKVKGGN